MLEVHPPEHAPHTVRDFFLHIFTITIGLLIALGLEALVEWRHHVHLRHEAEENLRLEIKANREDLDHMLQQIPGEQNNFKLLLAFFKERSAGRPTDQKQMQIGLSMTTPQEASWQTASATGVLSYMPYDEVQRFAAAYALQKQLVEIQSGALQNVVALEALAATDDPNTMSAGDAVVAVTHTRSLMANLEVLREVGQALEKAYGETAAP